MRDELEECGYCVIYSGVLGRTEIAPARKFGAGSAGGSKWARDWLRRDVRSWQGVAMLVGITGEARLRSDERFKRRDTAASFRYRPRHSMPAMRLAGIEFWRARHTEGRRTTWPSSGVARGGRKRDLALGRRERVGADHAREGVHNSFVATTKYGSGRNPLADH